MVLSRRWRRWASQSAAVPAAGGGPSLPRPQRSGWRHTRLQALLHPAGGDLEPPPRRSSSGGAPGVGAAGGGGANSAEPVIDVEAESAGERSFRFCTAPLYLLKCMPSSKVG